MAPLTLQQFHVANLPKATACHHCK